MGQAKLKRGKVNTILKHLSALGEAKTLAAEAAAAQLLHASFAEKLFVSDEYADYAYREAMSHEDLLVQRGLSAYLDGLLAFGWAPASQPDYAMTVVALVEVRTAAMDVVADLTHGEALTAAIAESLGVPAADVLMYPQLHDVSAYDGFLPLAGLVGATKLATESAPRENFRFGDTAGPGVFRQLAVRVRCADDEAYRTLALRLASPIHPTVAVAEVGYEVRDVTGARGAGQAYCKLTSIGLPFTLARESTFHEGAVHWSRWVKAAEKKGLALADLAVNIVVTDQGPVALPSGLMPTTAQEPSDPQVALVVGERGSKKVIDVILYYEGAHALLAVPLAASMLVDAQVGEVLIGGSQVDSKV